MGKLSHRIACLSILALAATALPAGPAFAGPNVYEGRWTVSDEKPVFSAKGLYYKTFDIAPCGKDFCGVSVDANGKCGPVLFRFLSKSIKAEQGLNGHGRWGNQKKNVEIYAYWDKQSQGGRWMSFNLGDGHDFGERSGNMPKYTAGYSPVGAAHCVVK